ncbi:importin-4 isoform X2 [Anas platyrhynchos]|uniref:importin-4 isoform X2 n=1 Tax=Anas platyrhynchos TaxID=8839 RepID=UPI003AF27FDB
MAAPELEALLEALLEPDSDGIRRVRQLAAVLLRRRLLGRWRRLDPDLRQRLPTLLAEALERETEHAVVVALAQLAALVLRRGGVGSWGPLGAWVQGAARDPRRKEVSLLVLSAALEDAPPALAPHGPALAALCRGGLEPGAPPTTLAYALRALGGLAATLGDAHTELLRSLVPDILRALRTLIDADEERGADALEVLDELLAAAPGAVTFDLRPLLDLCLQVGGDSARGHALRARALATLGFLAQQRPRALLRGGLLGVLLGGLLGPLCAPPQCPDPEDEEEPGGDDEGSRGGPSPRHAAAQVLNALAQGLPPEKLLKELVPLLEPALRSPRGWERKGGLLGLGALGDGCGGVLRRRYLSPVLGALRGGLGDPEEMVRGAAACALRSLDECLQPEAGALALEALPGALAALGGPRSWFVLEALVESAGEGLEPLLEPLLGALLGALGPPRTELALSALHTLAGAAGPLLQPHGGRILAALSPLLQPPQDPPGRALTLQALEVLGALGGAVAGPGLLPGLELALRLAQEEDEPEGRRVLFSLAAAVAEALGEGAGPLLPPLVPLLLGALRRPPPPAASEAPDSFLLFDDDNDEEGAEPMDDDVSSEEEELIEVEVGGAYAAEVEDACEALGEIAEHSGAAFLPYLDTSLEAVMGLLAFPLADVRAAAYQALGSLCLGAGRARGHAPKEALQALTRAVREEPGAGPARGALGGLGRALGSAPPPELLPAIGCLLADVIAGKISCLQPGAEEEEEGEEQVEAAAELRELAGEGLAAMAGGAGGGVAFAAALPPMLACLRGDLPQRSWAAAMLGEVGGALLGGVAPALLPRLGPALAAAALRDPHPEVRGNALCSLGRLAANGAGQSPAWPGLAAVREALGREGPGRARDNACGALARHGAGLTAREALSLLLPALPLAEALEEGGAVAEFLLGLPPEELEPFLGELPRALGGFIGTGTLPEGLEVGVASLLRQAWGRSPELVGGALAQLPPPDAARLRHALFGPAPSVTSSTTNQ